MLNGGSYGTTFFLDYARRHPSSVESLVLIGVAPPHFIIIPLQDAQGAQLSIDRLIAECKSDADCNRNFPSLGTHFETLAQRFDKGDISVPLRDATTKRITVVRLSKEVFTDRLRQLLYYPENAKYAPFIIDRAYRGNYMPLATMVDVVSRGFTKLLAEGLNLSVTCAEDIPFITEAEYLAHERALVRGRSSRPRAAASLPYLECESRPGRLCRAGAQRRADLDDLRKRRSDEPGEVRSRSAAVSAQRAYLVDSQRFARHRDGVQRPPCFRVRERGQRERA